MLSRTITIIALIAVFSACAGNSEPAPEYPALETLPPAASTASEASPAPAAEAPAPVAPAVKVTAIEHTPLPSPTPTLTMGAPRADQLIKSDKVEVKLDVKHWPLSPEGNHVHLIVDNEPYMAIRDASKPIDLRAQMQKDLGHDLAEGTHVLRVFPSRGHHESVKENGAFVARVFHFKKKSSDFAFDAKAPLLTYSRPKGCVEVGKPALLDFYVSGATLGDNATHVVITIDGSATSEITSWAPHHIENLAEGEHTLRLQLLDAQNNPAPGSFNDTTRTIIAKQSCAPAPAAPAVSTPAAAPASPQAPRVPEAAKPAAPVPTDPAPAK